METKTQEQKITILKDALEDIEEEIQKLQMVKQSVQSNLTLEKMKLEQ